MKQHITITDIANKLGISASTVSRALSDHPDIKTETKKLVQDLAKEFYYRPNSIAQSLKNKRTTIIGVIVPEIKHDFFSSAISGIEEVAYHAGFTIIVCQSNEDYEREVINTNSLIQQRVAGIVASISQNTKTGEHFQSVINRGIPLVFFDRACNDVAVSKVIIDDAKSAYYTLPPVLRNSSMWFDKSQNEIPPFFTPIYLLLNRESLPFWQTLTDAANRG